MAMFTFLALKTKGDANFGTSREKSLAESGVQCHKSFILSTADISPNAQDDIKNFIGSLENACFCPKNNKMGVIFVRDLNNRSPSWFDTRCDKSGQLLDQA